MNAEDNSDIAVAWNNVLAHWDRTSMHDAFLQTALANCAFGAAASYYRTQLDVPGRRDLANAKTAALMLLATHAMESEKSQRKPTPLWIRGLAVLMCIASLGYLYWAWMQ